MTPISFSGLFQVKSNLSFSPFVQNPRSLVVFVLMLLLFVVNFIYLLRNRIDRWRFFFFFFERG